MNLSSLIVDVRPEAMAAVQQQLAQWPGVEVHAATARGRLVLTLETESGAQTTDAYAGIGALDGVLSIALAYHQIEPEPDLELRHDADAT